MQTWSQMLFGLTVSVLSVAGFHIVDVSAWSDISGVQKQVLLAVHPSWNLLPVRDRAGPVPVAGKYGSVSADKQHKVSEGIVTWTTLCASERSAAREHYRQFRSLPPDKRRERMNKWKKQYLG
jgi:Protein of unknown function (DUF3106)